MLKFLEKNSWMISVIIGLLLLFSREIMSSYDIEGLRLGWNDVDTYMRLSQLESGGFASFFARDNAPFGMYTHWSFLFNGIVMLLALPEFFLTGDWHKALTSTQYTAMPCGLLLMVMSFYWILKPYRMQKLLPWVILILSLSSSVLGYAMIGRVNHHIWSVAMSVTMLGAVSYVSRKPSIGNGILAGIMFVLLSWESMETVTALVASWGLLVMVVLCKRNAKNFLLSFCPIVMLMSLYLFFINPPIGFSEFATDHYSGFHVAILWGLSLSLILIRSLKGYLPTGNWKIPFGFAVGAIPLLIIGLLMWLYLIPHIQYSDEYNAYFWNQISEVFPVWKMVTSPMQLLVLLFPGVYGLIPLGMRIYRKRHSQSAIILAMIWLILLCHILVGVVFVRASLYGSMWSALIIAGVLYRFFKRYTRPYFFTPGISFYHVAFGISLIMMSFISIPGLLKAEEPLPCAVTENVASQIEREMPNHHGVVLVDLWFSPYLLWRSHNLDTVAGPYHNNKDGITDMAHFMMNPNQSESLAMIQKRNIKAILACGDPSYVALKVFGEHSNNNIDHWSMGARLGLEKPPEWLREEKLSNTSLKLYWIKGQ